MDYNGVPRGSIRGYAFNKLAKLSFESHALSSKNLTRLLLYVPSNSCENPMPCREYEAMISICDAFTANFKSQNQAQLLLDKLGHYFSNLPHQRFSQQVLSSSMDHSPWEVLASKLTNALIKIAQYDKEYINPVSALIEGLMTALFRKSSEFSHSLIILGLIKGLKSSATFLCLSSRAFGIFTALNDAIDKPEFLSAVEEYSGYVCALDPTDVDAQVAGFSYMLELSPIMYLGELGSLMCAIVLSVCNTNSESLLTDILQQLSSAVDLNTFQGKMNPSIFKLESLALLNLEIIESLANLAMKKMAFLDHGHSCIVYSSHSRLKLGYYTKSSYVQVILAGLVTGKVDIDLARLLFKSSLQITSVMMDSDLGLATLQLGVLLVYEDDLLGAYLTRAFTSLVTNPDLEASFCTLASQSVGVATKVMSQDAVVTTIYALTNLVSGSDDFSQIHTRSNIRRGHTGLSTKSDLASLMSKVPPSSLSIGKSHESAVNYDEQEYQKMCQNAIIAIVQLSKMCDDETVVTLALSLLSQKATNVGTPIGKLLLNGLVSLAPFAPEREFIVLLRWLHAILLDAHSSQQPETMENISEACERMSINVRGIPRLFGIHLHETMQAIVNDGDVQLLEHHRLHEEISQVAKQLSVHLKSFAVLLPDPAIDEKPLEVKDIETIHLFRNVWFNLVIHGYFPGSELVSNFRLDLERIAYNTPPLASELSWGKAETLLELNAVLRRGLSNTNIRDQRNVLASIHETRRNMSYPKLMFSAAATLVETLRVRNGDCSTVLLYFSDPSLKSSGVSKYLEQLSVQITKKYITNMLLGPTMHFTGDKNAEQLTIMLSLCCHRMEELQQVALQCCDLLIGKSPSTLCHKRSLFALFDLLTVLFDSIADADENEYNPTWHYTTPQTSLKLLLPDSYSWRNATFASFSAKCRIWVQAVLQISNIDIKSLISTYASDAGALSSSSQRIMYGVSFALEMAGKIQSSDGDLQHISRYPVSGLNTLPSIVSHLSWRSGFVSGSISLSTTVATYQFKQQVEAIKKAVASGVRPSNNIVIDLINAISGHALQVQQNTAELYRYLVDLPFTVFNVTVMSAAIKIWLVIMKEIKGLSSFLMTEIAKAWEISIAAEKGLYNRKHDAKEPEFLPMKYMPSDYPAVMNLARSTISAFEPHLQVIRLFSSNFEATLGQSEHLLRIFTRFVEVGLINFAKASLHPLARFTRLTLLKFAFDVLDVHLLLRSQHAAKLGVLILDSALLWFRRGFAYPYGSNMLKTKCDFALLKEVRNRIKSLNVPSSHRAQDMKTVLILFFDDEIARIAVWLHPLTLSESKLPDTNPGILNTCYSLNPMLAINLAERYKIPDADDILHKLVIRNPVPAMRYPEAVLYFVGSDVRVVPTYHLLFWEPVSPIDSITLFLPPYGSNPNVIQYTMRSLEHHDVNTTFFYVPQIVQGLRSDVNGYVERFIVETAKLSQLFAHQIIWNMLANSYKDEDSLDPDAIKPVLDRIQTKITEAFSKDDLQFYRDEFGFFNEVTSISGKLKPYIKKTKAEKKVKIDEEMHKIKIKHGAYLPINPDGVVIDINRNSGKPLQSHAKAPFMATFKIEGTVESVDSEGDIATSTVERWQSCIFKVGDDCRQDVLALQLISVFRSIWTNAGLDMYVYPYRVVASAPGCGVIEVLPNSVSRDMLGREAVNGLYEYFTTKFGPESSIEFQKARNNLAKSLAAYSIISWLLQFKDRHNGNIMYDDQGHILHIDFGFCFDIVPGGVRFEAAPFKLTREMVTVLGGSSETEAFKWFEELCVKGFLACRPHMDTIIKCVTPMLESGLPCFKPGTIKNLRQRFVPHKNEGEAASYMRGLVRKSMESLYTKGYDEFQRITNGIPY